jgi:hypothetical protein
MVVTAPFHVVKLAKQAYQYVFVPAPSNPWDSIELEITSGSTGADDVITLDPSGKAHVETQATRTTVRRQFDDQATAAELKAVNDAFTAADVSTLPALIPDPRGILGVKKIHLTSTVQGNVYTLDASIDFYASYAGRVKPYVDALAAILDRIKTGTIVPTFDSVVVGYAGGFIAFEDTYTILKDGSFFVDRRNVSSLAVKTFTGQATPSELAAVQSAFSGADVSTLPNEIKRSHFVPDIGSTTIDSFIGGTDYKTVVDQSGDYGSYASRLKPLVDSIQTIADRVVKQAQGQTITGLVDFVKSTQTLTIGIYTIDLSDPLRPIVQSQQGLTVTVDAQVDPSTNVATLVDVQGTASRSLAVRLNPSRHSKSLAHLAKGDVVKIVGETSNKDWYLVEAAGVSGYVLQSHVKVGQ